MKSQINYVPANTVQVFYEKHQEFDEAHSALVRLLSFYRGLSLLDKVNEMEIYLVSFKSYLLKANQAQIILQEIFKTSNMH